MNRHWVKVNRISANHSDLIRGAGTSNLPVLQTAFGEVTLVMDFESQAAVSESG